MPRWSLEVWLWLTVLATFLSAGQCPTEWDHCRAVVEPLDLFVLDLFPGTSRYVFEGMGASDGMAALMAVGVAGVCHITLRRVLAKRVRLWVFVLAYAAALGLSVLCTFIGVALLAKVPLVTLLRDARP